MADSIVGKSDGAKEEQEGVVNANVPEVDVPEAELSEVEVPEADVPETDVSETDVPETDVPEAEVLMTPPHSDNEDDLALLPPLPPSPPSPLLPISAAAAHSDAEADTGSQDEVEQIEVAPVPFRMRSLPDVLPGRDEIPGMSGFLENEFSADENRCSKRVLRMRIEEGHPTASFPEWRVAGPRAAKLGRHVRQLPTSFQAMFVDEDPSAADSDEDTPSSLIDMPIKSSPPAPPSTPPEGVTQDVIAGSSTSLGAGPSGMFSGGKFRDWETRRNLAMEVDEEEQEEEDKAKKCIGAALKEQQKEETDEKECFKEEDGENKEREKEEEKERVKEKEKERVKEEDKKEVKEMGRKGETQAGGEGDAESVEKADELRAEEEETEDDMDDPPHRITDSLAGNRGVVEATAVAEEEVLPGTSGGAGDQRKKSRFERWVRRVFMGGSQKASGKPARVSSRREEIPEKPDFIKEEKEGEGDVLDSLVPDTGNPKPVPPVVRKKTASLLRRPWGRKRDSTGEASVPLHPDNVAIEDRGGAGEAPGSQSQKEPSQIEDAVADESQNDPNLIIALD